MIKDYFEFIFEAVDIKKTKIFYSPKFRDFLNGLRTVVDKDQEKIIDAILYSEDSNQMYLDITLIDLTDLDDMISFTQVSRLTRQFGEKSNDESDFEDWLRAITVSPNHDAWKTSRAQLKIGKFVKKLFDDNGFKIADSTLEKFVNKFKAHFNFVGDLSQRMELVDGELIRKWYLQSNYSQITGPLGSSCMRYPNCQGFLDIYVKNPEVCKLLVMYSDSNKTKISGRALVWKTTTGLTIVDRVYATTDSGIESIKLFAKDKGWTTIQGSGGIICQIKLSEFIFDTYPYMDNFHILDTKTGILTNTEKNWPSEGVWQLRQTDGSHLSDDGVWSRYLGETIPRDEAVYCGNVDDWLYAEEARYLEYKDMWASPDEDIAYSEFYGAWYYSEDCVFSEVQNDCFPPDTVIEIHTNIWGDTDYIHHSIKATTIEVLGKGGEFVPTLPRFVVKDPITGDLIFRDELDNSEALEKLKGIEPDLVGIKDYLLERDFVISEMRLSKLKRFEVPDFKFSRLVSLMNNDDFTKRLIKWALYVYPTKSELRGGLPEKPRRLRVEIYQRYGSISDSHDKYKEKFLNFDEEFSKKLLGEENWEKLNLASANEIWALLTISYSYIPNVFGVLEVYKWWWKWKFS